VHLFLTSAPELSNQPHALGGLPPLKSGRYSLDMSLSENHFLSGPFREEMYVFPLSTIEPEFFGCLVCGLAAAIVLSSLFDCSFLYSVRYHEVFCLPEFYVALLTLASTQ
jgi:hypothetical protein